jgi:hypothetical protein
VVKTLAAFMPVSRWGHTLAGKVLPASRSRRSGMRFRLALITALSLPMLAFPPSPAGAVTEGAKPAVRRGNVWYLRNTLTTGTADVAFAYGSANDLPLMGDWDGDGDKTPGVVRGNTWYLRNSNSAGNADIVFKYGSVGDIPFAGDWDDDGDETPAVVRGGGGCGPFDCLFTQTQWFLRNDNSAGTSDVNFTTPCPCGPVIPTIGGWDAAVGDDPGYRPVFFTNEFFLDKGSDHDFDTQFRFGSADDFPIAGDWNADGIEGVGAVRGNVWYLRNTLTDGVAEASIKFGSASDRFLVWR